MATDKKVVMRRIELMGMANVGLLLVEVGSVVTVVGVQLHLGAGCGNALLVETVVVLAAVADHFPATVRSKGHPWCG